MRRQREKRSRITDVENLVFVRHRYIVSEITAHVNTDKCIAKNTNSLDNTFTTSRRSCNIKLFFQIAEMNEMWQGINVIYRDEKGISLTFLIRSVKLFSVKKHPIKA